MTYITKDEIRQRWDTLPESLREAIVSEITTDFIWKTCEEEHIPEPKINDVARVASYVLLGFIHPGDLTGELADTLQMNKQVATAIANPIIARIFDPLKTGIDEAYAPPSKLDSEVAPIVQEIIDNGPLVI